MKRYPWLAVVVLALAPGLAQQSRQSFSYPEYFYVAVNASELYFDFQAESSPDPGALAGLDPRYYPDLEVSPATAESWRRCLNLGDAASGTYEAQTSPGALPRPCRFAPTRVVRERFKALYRVDDAECQDLRTDGDLLVITNVERWQVEVRVWGTGLPEGTAFFLLPLTRSASGVLCARRARSLSQVLTTDMKPIESTATNVSVDPSDPNARDSYSYYTDYAAVYLVPSIYALEVDPGRLDPELAGGDLEVLVEYVVGAR